MSIEYEEFGPYAVYECLGTGGMATVHRAIYDDGQIVREVALKRLLPQHADDKTFVDDFVREGKLAARLSHPSIVHIFEMGRIDRTQFIAMELVVGQPMMQLIRAAHTAKAATPIGVVIALIAELCDAVDYACNGTDPETGERFNFVHRDLSPSNLLITDDGHLKVIDFGVAKATAGKRFTTSTGLVKGKLGYMSVEALAGKPVDGRSDVFSVGVVAWELITGKRLFTGKTELEVIQRVRDGAVVPPSTFNSACPPTLDAIVVQALARGRDDRFETAGAMRKQLEMLRRAYREEATPANVIAWREELVPSPPGEPRPRKTDATPAVAPPPSDPEPAPERPRRAETESETEMTQHIRPRVMRQHTILDLFEDEPPPPAPLPVAAPAAPAHNEFDDSDVMHTVQAGASYPQSALGEQATRLYPNPAESYMEMSVTHQPPPTITATAPLPSISTTTLETQAAPELPPGATLEMMSLQLEESIEQLLDLADEPAPRAPSPPSRPPPPAAAAEELLDLDLEPPLEPPHPDLDLLEPPTHHELSANDTIVVKRGG